jgi:hypothetical protein
MLLLFVLYVLVTDAFAPSRSWVVVHPSNTSSRANLAAIKSSSSKTATASSLLPNPLKQLPWVKQKEREREARRLKLERAQLHRQLGIAEDAQYEEIVAATDALIRAAGDNLKEKVKIEIAKDRILQIRLNERLAGLASSTNKEARAQSTYEVEG